MAAKGLQLRTNASIKHSEVEEAISPSGSKRLQVSMEGHMDNAEMSKQQQVHCGSVRTSHYSAEPLSLFCSLLKEPADLCFSLA